MAGQNQWDDEDYLEAKKVLGDIVHFWQYVNQKMLILDSVQFINF